MTYISGGLIQATDFNGFVSTNAANINGVWNSAYGQPALSTVAANGTITATQWSTLNSTLTSAATHQGTTITGRTNPTAGATITILANVSTDITNVSTNRFNAATIGSEYTSWTGTVSKTTNTGNSTGTWTLTFTDTITFANAAAANTFFNGGGLIKIQPGKSSTGQGGDTAWNTLASAVGTIYLTSTAASKTIAGVNYTGTTKIGGSGTANIVATGTGFFQLTSSNVTIFKQFNTGGNSNDYIQVNALYSSNAITLTTDWFSNVGTGTISGGTSASGGTLGTAPTTLVTYFPPETVNLTNVWGTPTVASTVSANVGPSPVPPAQASCSTYTTAGTYTWVAPLCVSSVSVVAVGGGGGGATGTNSLSLCSSSAGGAGGGGGLAYKNNVSVTPGNSYTVVVGVGGVGGSSSVRCGGNGGSSSIFSGGCLVTATGGSGGLVGGNNFGGAGGNGGAFSGTGVSGATGGRGGNGSSAGNTADGAGGGGGAGYTGNGGAGGTSGTPPTAGAGGGGGGGGARQSSGRQVGAGGGGVGIYGQGCNGAAGTNGTDPTGGGGGSGGTGGTGPTPGPSNAGVAGGGGAGGFSFRICSLSFTDGRPGAIGAVRIIWPGCSRAFPSTNTGNVAAAPGAPTSVTATGSYFGASVAFTAPTNLGFPKTITGYQVISTPGCFTATGNASPIFVSCLAAGTSYTFRVRAQNATGFGAYSSASGAVTPTNTRAGSTAYTTAGSYTWVAPPGVTAVSIVAVGGGGGGTSFSGGGGGGGLGWLNNFSVTPGSSYAVQVGAGYRFPNTCSTAGQSFFGGNNTVRGNPGGNDGGAGGNYVGTGGGNGGRGGTNTVCDPDQSGGGGAGGYSGNGGDGGSGPSNSGRTAGAGGGGGGGAANTGGGGVGLFGEGASGGISLPGGGGGSGGTSGINAYSSCKPSGGRVGGGSGGAPAGTQSGSPGGVRIVYPGNTRSFPSTNVSAAGDTPVPCVPTSVTATAGDASASVAFTAPSCVGTSAITGYRVKSNPGCFTATGTSSPITVSGLTNGTPYTFRVQATNSTGYGPYSSASNSVTPAVPNYIEDVFSTWLYTGNGSTQTITNGIDLAGKGGMAWIKTRSVVESHVVVDTVRGASNALRPNSTAASINDASRVSAFTASGFTVGNNGETNDNNVTYASWTFREQPKFFDVVTWTGNDVNGRAIPHSLGSVPGCIIVKSTSFDGTDWVVHHRSLGFTQVVYLNSTAAAETTTRIMGATSTTFTVSDASALNSGGQTYVAYLFAHNAGGFGLTGTDNVITCSSFNTDGSGNASVTLGYEPQWILYKPTSTTGSWEIYDTMRGLSLTSRARLLANSSDAEATIGATTGIQINATGFNWVTNSPNTTFIYIAIRRGPMKVPTLGTSVYNAVTVTGNSTPNRRITGYGFPLDLLLSAGRTGSYLDKAWNERLIGAYYLRSNVTAAEDIQFGGLAASPFAYQDGYQTGTNGGVQYYWNNSGDTYVQYGMRRAPGFFDVVCYTGTGSARTVAHNLAAVPELMIVKIRNQAGAAWAVYNAASGNTKVIRLNTTAAETTSSAYWNNTSPTSSVFTVGNDGDVNNSGDTYVSYLFATCPGVSRVGSFTGTGATQVINCGFTGGARFVLIKATSTTGNWLVWDSARGIVSGNDPYLALNSTAAEVTNTDWVDTAATGFELSNAGGNLANSSGVSYIFLAIA